VTVIEDPVLEVVGLTSGYGDLAATRDISLRIHKGEILALLGPNGAGKSTTLLGIVGLLPRMRGEVRWLGRRTKAPLHRLAREGLAFVPEGRTVIAELSVRDNLKLVEDGVDRVLQYFPELERLLSRRAGLLSGGEQQMVALGRALARRPKALLVDEVTLGLAPVIADRLFSVMSSACQEQGLAILMVEQQTRRALSVANRWHLLRNGVTAAEGDASDTATLEANYLALGK
jgi:branched-chain amino acid transport system ATP-binding protein